MLEAQLSPQSAVDALYAVGRHDALGYAPFSIEDADQEARPWARATTSSGS